MATENVLQFIHSLSWLLTQLRRGVSFWRYMPAFRDLTGQIFNRLTVIERAEKNKQGNYMWKCRCECGTETLVSSTNLLTNHTQSCGCFGNEKRAERRTFNIIGERHNRLTVVEYVGRSERGEQLWKCACECGGEKIATTADIRFGAIKSCGCLPHDVLVARNTTHGMTGTPEYNRARWKKHKDKRKKLDVEWSFEIQRALKEFYTDCVICHSTENLEIDHVRPAVNGNGLRVGNVTILCRKHNHDKGILNPEDLPDEMRIPILESAERFKEWWEATSA